MEKAVAEENADTQENAEPSSDDFPALGGKAFPALGGAPAKPRVAPAWGRSSGGGAATTSRSTDKPAAPAKRGNAAAPANQTAVQESAAESEAHPEPQASTTDDQAAKTAEAAEPAEAVEEEEAAPIIREASFPPLAPKSAPATERKPATSEEAAPEPLAASEAASADATDAPVGGEEVPAPAPAPAPAPEFKAEEDMFPSLAPAKARTAPTLGAWGAKKGKQKAKEAAKPPAAVEQQAPEKGVADAKVVAKAAPAEAVPESPAVAAEEKEAEADTATTDQADEASSATKSVIEPAAKSEVVADEACPEPAAETAASPVIVPEKPPAEPMRAQVDSTFEFPTLGGTKPAQAPAAARGAWGSKGSKGKQSAKAAAAAPAPTAPAVETPAEEAAAAPAAEASQPAEPATEAGVEVEAEAEAEAEATPAPVAEEASPAVTAKEDAVATAEAEAASGVTANEEEAEDESAAPDEVAAADATEMSETSDAAPAPAAQASSASAPAAKPKSGSKPWQRQADVKEEKKPVEEVKVDLADFPSLIPAGKARAAAPRPGWGKKKDEPPAPTEEAADEAPPSTTAVPASTASEASAPVEVEEAKEEETESAEAVKETKEMQADEAEEAAPVIRESSFPALTAPKKAPAATPATSSTPAKPSAPAAAAASSAAAPAPAAAAPPAVAAKAAGEAEAAVAKEPSPVASPAPAPAPAPPPPSFTEELFPDLGAVARPGPSRVAKHREPKAAASKPASQPAPKGAWAKGAWAKPLQSAAAPASEAEGSKASADDAENAAEPAKATEASSGAPRAEVAQDTEAAEVAEASAAAAEVEEAAEPVEAAEAEEADDAAEPAETEDAEADETEAADASEEAAAPTDREADAAKAAEVEDERGDEDGEEAEDEEEIAAEEPVQPPAPAAAGTEERRRRGGDGEAACQENSDRGIEDIETADSSGTGLKGDVASQTPTEGEESDSEPADADSDEDRGSAFESVQSAAPSDEPAADADAPEAKAETKGRLTGISLRPSGNSTGKQSLLSGIGSQGLSRGRNIPAMSIPEILRWRGFSDAASTSVHCTACEWDAEAAEQSTSSRPRLEGGSWRDQQDRRPRGDRPNSGRNFRSTPKGNQRRGKDFDDEPVEPLQVSTSSWVQQQRSFHEERHTASGGTAEITRSIRSVLNKLTLEKFASLLQQLLSCGISTQEHLEILMHEVMEKATTQHHFITMYTELCMVLESWTKEKNIGDTAKDPKAGFKKILLNECQASFERYLRPPDHLKELQGEELLEAEVKWKTARMGNIRFVGMLLAKKMVASQVIIAVTGELLQEPLVPEALESLAAFLTVIGPNFDHPTWSYHKNFCDLFDTVAKHAASDRVPLRVRCLLSDVLDLRKDGWQDHKTVTKKDAGPMTLDEIHQRARADDGFQSARSTPKGSRPGSNDWGSRDSQRQGRGGSQGGAWGRSNSGQSSGTSQGGHSHKNRPSISPSPNSEQASPRSHHANRVMPSPKRASDQEFKREQNLDKLQKECKATLQELIVARDVEEAVMRLKELRLPVEHQATELSHLLGQAVEEAKPEVRNMCFRFVVRLFVDKIFAKSELLVGLTRLFTKSYQELLLDTPALPMILREELLPALGELTQAGMLTEDNLEELARHIQ